MDVEIEYCVPCGHLDRAIETQRHLLETHGEQLDTVALRTGSGGVFIVRADGQQVWDAKDDGYDLEVIDRIVSDRLAAA